ncbi:MAG: three-Cys-motif partner protein TcmP [Devosia marina]|uniref:three-Cys-motif partner protein TcmP n=1 Tax=Devosia marina TaxID=2683198 RepID=UPI0032EE38F0
MPVDHEFGGLSTDLKLSVVEQYLQAYTTALRNRFSRLWYIDAFAGTGTRAIKHAATAESIFGEPAVEARTEYRRGSALIAIETAPAFDRLVFMEAKASHAKALRELCDGHTHRDIRVVQGDANTAILADIAQTSSWSSTRAVMFLDPYGMSVDWDTLVAVSQTRAIDVWYLVSLSGLFRQATRDAEALEPSKRAALNRMLGTTEWESAWYETDLQPNMFGEYQRNTYRWADVSTMERYVGERLATIFPKVLPPLRLHNERGAPMFALFFAIANPDPKAIGLATKIAGHILNSARTGNSS